MSPPELLEVDLQTIERYRTEYLDALPEAQEAFLEMLMHSAQHFVIRWRAEEIGYVSVHAEKTLIEFFLLPEARSFAQDLFPLLIRELKIETAWVKSFDHLFLSCVFDHQRSITTKGLLVRDYFARPLPVIERIRYERRVASVSDFEAIARVEQDVFTNHQRLKMALQDGRVHVFERDHTLVGFCIVRPVIPGRTDVDIGIAVDAPFRNHGYAVYMLRDMVELAIAQGLHPVTGCEQSNVASFRLGRRIGFVATHRLVEARFL